MQFKSNFSPILSQKLDGCENYLKEKQVDLVLKKISGISR